MNKLIFLLAATLLFGLSIKLNNSVDGARFYSQSLQQIAAYKKSNAIGCFADNNEVFADNPPSIPLLEGRGIHTMKVSTQNDSASLYFNQGMNMFYGFHFIESRASFKKAQTFDSTCALAYLGEALTYGPNINNAAYKLRPYVLTLLEKAKRFQAASSSFEKALIEAQQIRYLADTSLGLQKVNEAYANAMKNVSTSFPSNADAAGLYADALMQLHPWDLYDNVGNPKSWTAWIEGEITKLLHRFPDHPGLNHYYIHCVEGSNTASRGLESANKLPVLTPGLSHMLHMSSHIYVRTGYYTEGVRANQKAIDAYEQYKKIFPDVQKYVSLYYTHNLSMQFANALMLPDFGAAAKIAWLKREPVIRELEKSNEPLSNDQQYSYCLPYLAWVRYGKWDSILAESNVNSQLNYVRLLQSFAKGMAYARTAQIDDASKELGTIGTVVNHPDLQVHDQFENAPAAAGKVALFILKGVIAEEQGRFDDAISALQEAVKQEDSMIYNEPKDWLVPARQYLGHALLSAKQFSKAETIFKEDLKLNPKNIWSLQGLLRALSSQHKSGGSDVIKKELKKASIQSDIKIESAVF